jgi:hypothetical protein
MRSTELIWYRLRFPRELDEAAVRAALTGLAGVSHRTRLVFDLSAGSAGIEHHLAISHEADELLLAGLRAAIPSLQTDATDAPSDQPGKRLLWQLAPRSGVIQGDLPAASSAGLLASLFPLSGHEQVRLTWRLRSSARPPLAVTPENRRDGYISAMRPKLALAGLNAEAELRVSAGSRARTAQLLHRTTAVLRSLSTPYGRLMHDPVWYGRLLYWLGLRGHYLSVGELASVIGWPIGAPDLPGLELGSAKRLVPSRTLAEGGRVLGVSDFAGVSQSVAISPTASTRGLYLLGPTGTGKTSLIKNLVSDDLRAGRGLAVIESNGDLIQDLLDLIPADRQADVILLDPTDPTHAVGFNPFAASSDPALVADQLGELFERLWSAFWGPRTAQLAHMGLLTLARRPGSTLVDLPRLFLDASFRGQVLKGLDDPIGLEPDWQWFGALAEREQATVIAPLLNKVRSFNARPAIRAIIGQPQPPISMAGLLAEGKVLLAYLPKGLIGSETAQLLGCLLLTSLWQAATARASLPPDQRTPFGLYVDEVQDFAAAPIPWDEMFAQGRKYGLSLTVAHQNLGQLDRALREVVLANARSKAVFALSPDDARVLERLFAPALTAADLQALDAYSVAAQVALDDGSTARPVTLRTPAPPKSLGSSSSVQRASREHYATPRVEVESRLRAGVSRPATPVGRRRRTP